MNTIAHIGLLWFTIWSFTWSSDLVTAQSADNTPPVLRLDRRWQISPEEPVGSVVTRVRADDAEHDPLTFGLESMTGGPPPFTIENSTGVVYLNESLKDRLGESILLWVTVSDGKLTAKTEVWASVTNATGGQRGPSLPGRMRPPFLSLPGFPSRSPSFPNFPIGGSIYQNTPVYPTQNQPPPRSKPVQQYTYIGSQEPPEKPEETSINVTQLDTTKLLPTEPNKTSPVEVLPSKPTITNEDDNNKLIEIISNDISNEKKVENFTSGSPAVDHNFTLTVIPVVSICCLFVIAGIIVLVMWKRTYKKRNSLKKGHMTKDPSGGIVLQEDPSLALQGWDGPQAFSNRYESWEHNHLQMTQQSSFDESKQTVDSWEIPRHHVRIFNIVGEGAFGQVWRAHATDVDGQKGAVTVAVKTLKENASEKEKADLLLELQVMKSLESHPNVVRLLGCCTEKEPTFVIMEFISLGKLQGYLRASRAERHYGNTHGGSRTLTSRDLTAFAYQVARGMEFLSSKGIIHRDLAARNILITEEHTCKVADFGFARDVGDTHVYERKSDGRLPIRWMAPESLYDDIFSVKSDVWSFGVLIWEIVTLGSTPYPGLSAGDVMSKVRDGHRLEKPEHCRRELYNVMYYCWDADPQQRPSFTECVALLEKLLLTETDYIELERFPDHSYYNVVSLEGEKL